MHMPVQVHKPVTEPGIACKFYSLSCCEPVQADGKSKGAAGKRASTLGLLRQREANMLGGTTCGMTSPQRCHLGAFVYQPAVPAHCIDTMRSRAYIGQFSGDGEVFIGQSSLLLLNTCQCDTGRSVYPFGICESFMPGQIA